MNRIREKWHNLDSSEEIHPNFRETKIQFILTSLCLEDCVLFLSGRLCTLSLFGTIPRVSILCVLSGWSNTSDIEWSAINVKSTRPLASKKERKTKQNKKQVLDVYTVMDPWIWVCHLRKYATKDFVRDRFSRSSCGIRKPRLWNPEYSSRNPESGYPTNVWIRKLSSSDKKIRNYLKSGIHNVESRIQDCLGFPYIRRIAYIRSFLAKVRPQHDLYQ